MFQTDYGPIKIEQINVKFKCFNGNSKILLLHILKIFVSMTKHIN